MSHPEPPPPGYDPGGIILYGVQLSVSPGPNGVHISVDVPGLSGFQILLKRPNAGYELALIDGYAFEGSCYKLDKVKIMVVKKNGRPALGCGYNDYGSSSIPTRLYQMWSVNKQDRSVQIELTQNFFEQLVLEDNLPGRRNQNTYHSHMQLSHRGGRLND